MKERLLQLTENSFKNMLNSLMQKKSWIHLVLKSKFAKIGYLNIKKRFLVKLFVEVLIISEHLNVIRWFLFEDVLSLKKYIQQL